MGKMQKRFGLAAVFWRVACHCRSLFVDCLLPRREAEVTEVWRGKNKAEVAEVRPWEKYGAAAVAAAAAAAAAIAACYYYYCYYY